MAKNTIKQCRYCANAEWAHEMICNLTSLEVSDTDHCEKFRAIEGDCGYCCYFNPLNRQKCILLEPTTGADAPACLFFEHFKEAQVDDNGTQ